jgi:hypothetical protein
MPTKLKDNLEKVRKLDNRSNSEILIEFYEYLRAVRTSLIQVMNQSHNINKIRNDKKN